MMVVRVYRQVFAFVLRNFNLSKRYLPWEVVFLVYHIVGALAIGFLAENMKGADADFQTILLFLLIGEVMWVYLASIFQEVGNQISYERWEGTIEYTFMAPMKRFVHLFGNSAYAVLYGIIRTGIVLLFVVLLFNVDMSQANPLAALTIVLVSALSFIGLGMIASIIPLMSPEKGAQALHIVEALLMLVSGIYYEIEVLPGWMQFISQFSPATYALDGMRQSLIHDASVGSLGMSHLMPLFVMGFVFVPLGVYVFSKAEKRAKRIGSLKRNG
ncbi:MAG: ABC transporter permease [Candidatus Woesearchaeota archaeon]